MFVHFWIIRTGSLAFFFGNKRLGISACSSGDNHLMEMISTVSVTVMIENGCNGVPCYFEKIIAPYITGFYIFKTIFGTSKKLLEGLTV